MKPAYLFETVVVGALAIGLAAAAQEGTAMPDARLDKLEGRNSGEFIEVPTDRPVENSFSLIPTRPKTTTDQVAVLREHEAGRNAAAPGGSFSATGELRYFGAVAPIQLAGNGLWFTRLDDAALVVKVENRGGTYVVSSAIARGGQVTAHPAQTLRMGASNRLTFPGGIVVVLTPRTS